MRWLVVAATAAGVALVLGAAVWAWVQVPGLYPPPAPGGDPAVAATREATRSQAIVTTRASVLAALAGIGALATIAINYRNSAIANRNARIASGRADRDSGLRDGGVCCRHDLRPATLRFCTRSGRERTI